MYIFLIRTFSFLQGMWEGLERVSKGKEKLRTGDWPVGNKSVRVCLEHLHFLSSLFLLFPKLFAFLERVNLNIILLQYRYFYIFLSLLLTPPSLVPSLMSIKLF